MALTGKDLFSIAHYEYGEAYFGSLQGMRFRVAREPLEDVHYTPPEKRGACTLLASVWPEPDSYRSAPDHAVISKNFPFTQEGLDQAVEWLNEIHESGSYAIG